MLKSQILKILLLENIHPRAHKIFRDENIIIKSISNSLDEQELCEAIHDVSVLGIRSKTNVTKRVLENAERLLAVGAYCIGTNQIDIKVCSDKGIAVFNAPYSNSRSVVELVLGEIIMLIRSVFEKSNRLHKGYWSKTANGNHEVRGKKLGIVGYGNIGSQLSVLAESLGMNVYYYDLVDKLALGNAKKCDTFEQLLRKCDIISVHVDGRPENRNLISYAQFDQMKNGVFLLNLSRGYVVDIAALTKNLKNNKVKGAAVDVFPSEPKNNRESFISELQNIPNVIITPHIGGSTEEAQQNIADFVSNKIMDFIHDGSTMLSVNFPNLQLPEIINAHRLMHVHRNVPGILAKINNILATHSINIVGQYLKTNDNIGYVITDISREYEKNVINDIKNIAETIRFRIIY